MQSIYAFRQGNYCEAANWLGVTRVRSMVEIILGAFVVIGVFVFWCDVTDSWNNVFRRYKDWETLVRALLPL